MSYDALLQRLCTFDEKWMCLSDDRGLAGNVMREAADALAALQKAIGLADAKLAFAMVYAADAAAADHRAQSAPAARAAITHIRNARGDLGAFLSSDRSDSTETEAPAE